MADENATAGGGDEFEPEDIGVNTSAAPDR